MHCNTTKSQDALMVKMTWDTSTQAASVLATFCSDLFARKLTSALINDDKPGRRALRAAVLSIIQSGSAALINQHFHSPQHNTVAALERKADRVAELSKMGHDALNIDGVKESWNRHKLCGFLLRHKSKLSAKNMHQILKRKIRFG